MKKSLLLLSALAFGLQAGAQQLAFPGAEGFGAYATGGRGGEVVHVTNLKASGPGSLADAVSKSNRIVVFDVGGVIDVTNVNLTVAGDNITIAGQTAPGEGITIYGGRFIMSKRSNIIMRYIRMRGSLSMPSDKCTLTMDDCQNVIMDHCTISWGRWDNIHIKNAKDITYQNCIISEGIDPQNFGAITDGTRNWTISHCLWANNKSRNPKMKCYLQYYNNVVYNYSMGIIGGHSAADNYQDVMNNYFITGPSTGTNKYFDDWTETDHLYSVGNYTDDSRDGQLNGRLITDYNGATPMQNPNLTCNAPMNLETAEEAYYSVLEHAGASRMRDSHDRRIIEQLASLGTKGAIIDSEQEVGGIGTLAGGTAPVDTDGDGMPDEWELANGTNPKVADSDGDVDGNGYTNIEDYINSLAHKSDYLMYPQAVTATMQDATTVLLTWKNLEEDADSIVIEQSEDGVSYAEVERVAGTETQATISGLTEGKVCYFRLKAVKGEEESLYSSAVSVNDEHMRPAGGIPAGTTKFVPEEGKLYRIINYGTVAYNSSTTFAGNPKYLKFAADGKLVSTGEFTWNNPELLWEITANPADESQVFIRNYATKQYLNPGEEADGEETYVTAVDEAAPFVIEFSGDENVAQSGLNTQVAMFRIESPQKSGNQLRPKNFETQWIWGAKDLHRADMVYTFSSVDADMIGLYTDPLDVAIAEAEQLAGDAEVGDYTLAYPEEALDALSEAIAVAKEELAKANRGESTQEQVNAAASALAEAKADFEATRIMTFAGYDSTKVFNIYSYGTISNSSATTATSDIERRYLSTVKFTDGVTDSLVFRVGLSDDAIAAGQLDDVANADDSRWNITPAGDGYVYIRSEKTGAYVQVGGLLSTEPVAIYPYYAKDDNGKHAFYLQKAADNTRLIQIGTPDADGLGGSVAFAYQADRTRLRWVIEQLGVATGISEVADGREAGEVVSVEYYNLQGMKLGSKPASGIYVVKSTHADGTVSTVKVAE